MSGHSHWATIKHKKLAQDAKKGKIFSKFARQLMVLAREGGDNPTFNVALAKAIREAKQSGMPMDKIELAVKKGAGKVEGQTIETKTYEGKGVGGVMMIIETLTDNSNRTSMEIRKLLERNNGAMVNPGAASNQFERKGYIYVSAQGVADNDLENAAIDAGADSFEKKGDVWEIVTSFESFNNAVTALEKKFKIESSETPLVPKYGNYVELSDTDARKLKNLVDLLEDHDDVQKVYHNGTIPESVLAG